MPNKPSGESLERARKLVLDPEDSGPLDEFEREYQIAIIANALDLAESRGRAQENEACAKVAEKAGCESCASEYGGPLSDGNIDYTEVSKAIRQRMRGVR